MKTIHAVCFDMDGVIVDSERLSPMLVREAAKLQGCEMSEQDALRSVGSSVKSLSAILESLFPGKINTKRFMQDWYDLTMTHVRTHGVPLKPYAREILAHLRERGIRLGLCTSNVAKVVLEYMELAGLTDAFDVIVTGEMAPCGKPDPALYLLCAEKLGVSPEHCAGVEDSFNGVRAVRAAGMVSLMVPDVLPYTEDFAPYVDQCLPDLMAVQAHLESLV